MPIKRLFKYTFILILLFASHISFAQINGGESAFSFLTLPNGARVTGLGGAAISINDNDPNLGQQNPALYRGAMSKKVAVGANAYLADLIYGNAVYVVERDSGLTAAIGVQYLNYGDFTASDASGNVTGDFSGNDVALLLGLSYQKNNWSYGAHLKPIFSGIESYSAFGAALDLGVNYFNPETDFSFSVVAKNAGVQLRNYQEGTRAPLPFDLQMGVSKRLKYLPLRVMVTAHHLHTWDIRYDDPSLQVNNTLIGEDEVTQNYFADILFRHLIFGGEFYFGKNVRVQLGYNHLRRQELRLTQRGGLLGFSFGLGMRIKRFELNYGRGNYHFADGSNHLSVTFSLSKN